MSLKIYLTIIIGLFISGTALCQHQDKYELEREMPIFLDQIKKRAYLSNGLGKQYYKKLQPMEKSSTANNARCYDGPS